MLRVHLQPTKLLVAVPVVVMICLACANDATAVPFTADSVDALGGLPSLAMDAQGVPRMSYAKVVGNTVRLVYASKSGGTWTSETVDSSVANVGQYSSLALDTQGNPRISYYDQTNQDLKYASKSGGTWTLETVDSNGSAGLSTSLALDAQGNPRISYYESTNSDLKYASKSGSNWSVEKVDSLGNAGAYASLALDAQGNPHISYYHAYYFQNTEDLKYATKASGVWTLVTLQETGTVGQHTSIALNAQDEPRISYLDQTNGDLEYASKSGGTWTFETVDSTGYVGQHSSLALDGQGNPRISYYDLTNTDLKYARKSGGAWSLEVVDNCGQYETSMELQAGGNPYIAYRSPGCGGLKVASRDDTPPAAISNLSPIEACYTYVIVSWTTPGDDGTTGTAAAYDLRFSSSAITEANFSSASEAEAPTPGSPGSTAQAQIYLTSCSSYYFAVKTRDEASNWSPLSNVVTASTTCHHLQCDVPEEVPGGGIRADVPERVEFAQAGPNPTGASALLEYAVPSEQAGTHLDLSVFDVAGRRIHTLAEGAAKPGFFTVSWDLETDDGGRVPAGAYFVRLRVGSVELRRVIVALP